MFKKVVDATVSDAAKIVDLVGTTLDQIQETENRLNLVCPIIGEVKTEEGVEFDLLLAETVNLAVKDGNKVVGYLSANHLKNTSNEYLPSKKYPANFESFYVNTLIVSVKTDQNNELFYDLQVLNLLFEELRNIAGQKSLVMNLPENLPQIARVAKTLSGLAGFKGICVRNDFFGKDEHSWFLESVQKEEV